MNEKIKPVLIPYSRLLESGIPKAFWHLRVDTLVDNEMCTDVLRKVIAGKGKSRLTFAGPRRSAKTFALSTCCMATMAADANARVKYVRASELPGLYYDQTGSFIEFVKSFNTFVIDDIDSESANKGVVTALEVVLSVRKDHALATYASTCLIASDARTDPLLTAYGERCVDLLTVHATVVPCKKVSRALVDTSC